MTSPGRRRRPPQRRARDESAGAEPARPSGRRSVGPNAFRGVLIAGAIMIVGVLVIALATGTTDQLPWGAIIGVVAVMVFAFIAGRRRARAFGAEEEP